MEYHPVAFINLWKWDLKKKLNDYHRFNGLELLRIRTTLEMSWPEHSTYPQHGYVVRRCDLDQFVAENAVNAGASLLQGVEAHVQLKGKTERLRLFY